MTGMPAPAGGVSSAWSSLRLVCPRCAGALRCQQAGAVCLGCAAEYPLAEGVLDLRLGRRGDAGYRPEYFDSLESHARQNFWFAARRRTVLEALKRTVPDLAARRLFDIGCGSGNLTRYLSDNGVALAGGCDAYPEALAFARRKVDVPLVLVDEGRMLPLGAGQDLIGMFDVLEHMDEDVATLEHLASLLAPGGIVALTVPAHPFLFDEMDVLACHRRRYDRAGLRARLEGAGFRIRLLSHFMAPLVPLLMASRIAGRCFARWRSPLQRRSVELRPIPLVNELLGLLISIERPALRRVALPFGSSLVAIAERPART